MRHGKVGLQLGRHQKYYISRCEEKQSIQLTITVVGDDITSTAERREVIDDVTQLLDNIMKVFMPEVKKAALLVPCPLCSTLHITLSEVSTGATIFCTAGSSDDPLDSGYYSDLGLNSPVLMAGDPGVLGELHSNILADGHEPQ